MSFVPLYVLFGSFFVLLAIGLPISFAIGLSAVATMLLMMPLDQSLFIIAQRMSSGLDSFTLLAIPFFILAGNIMNRGGIARRLVDFALVLGGRLPGSLAHVNVLSNMMFGAISGSAVASAAAVGGVLAPMQRREGMPPEFSAAVNIASCPTGMLIPPSTTFIVYSLISGGTSVAALFVAGYVPGIMLGLGMMLVAGIIAARRGYPRRETPPLGVALRAALAAVLPLGLVVLIMGGIVGGFFTATEASAMAVLYALILALLVYREIGLRDLPAILIESTITSTIVLLLIGVSLAMSLVMTFADVPFIVAEALQALAGNPVWILLFITLSLLVIGTFMDMTPALLIFYAVFVALLFVVVFVPELSLFLPRLLLGYGA